ncbi:TPA: hypothetical protein ACKSGT_005580 [Pseudomonas aeruginosa]
MRAVIDTNVLRVASGQHADVSFECVSECVRHLRSMQLSGVAVIDDGYRILSEYLKNPSLLKTNEVGGQFLKWLLQNQGNQARVEQVPLTETVEHCFSEFPDKALEPYFVPLTGSLWLLPMLTQISLTYGKQPTANGWIGGLLCGQRAWK